MGEQKAKINTSPLLALGEVLAHGGLVFGHRAREAVRALAIGHEEQEIAGRRVERGRQGSLAGAAYVAGRKPAVHVASVPYTYLPAYHSLR